MEEVVVSRTRLTRNRNTLLSANGNHRREVKKVSSQKGSATTQQCLASTADDELLSFFAATFAPVKFERSPERLAETLLR
jgi:predicted Zn-dependent peptidase